MNSAIVKDRYNKHMKMLYVIPTPIGNLEDMTLRAINILKKVQLIAAEDTRVTRHLLDHYQIKTATTSYHEHNESTKSKELLQFLGTGDLALVSDAGTPGISDPGYRLIKEAISRDIRVVVLPGATAFVPALVASGLPTDRFTFLGFLAKKSGARIQTLQRFTLAKETLILYESPYRLTATLKDVLKILGNRQVCVGREISKKFETYYRSDVKQTIKYFEENQIPGEMVIVIEGNLTDLVWSKTQLIQALESELQQGKLISQVTKELAQLSGWNKKQVYQLALTMKF